MSSTNLYTDYINKTYKSCGCIFISELDIIDNLINEKYIQICKKHSIHNNILIQCHNKIITITSEIYLNFGKYKNKSFSYVFHTDKLYCYNLAFWKNNDNKCKNINIMQFINYIKQQISL
jgi:hypothetical protein